MKRNWEDMESMARDAANFTRLPQTIWLDQDGYLNHSAFGIPYVERLEFEQLVTLLPDRYFD